MVKKTEKMLFPLIKKRDLIVVGAIIVAIILMVAYEFFLKSGYSEKAVVRSDGNIICEISLLSDSQTNIESFGYNFTLTVKNGKIAVTYAECPDKVCFHTGYISKPGQTIVCLPAKVTIELENRGKASFDARTY